MKKSKAALGFLGLGLAGALLTTGCDSGSEAGSSISETEVGRLLDGCNILTLAEASVLLGKEVTKVTPASFPPGAVCTYSVGSAALPQLVFSGISGERWKAYTSLDESALDMLESKMNQMEPKDYKRLDGIGDGAYNEVGWRDRLVPDHRA